MADTTIPETKLLRNIVRKMSLFGTLHPTDSTFIMPSGNVVPLTADELDAFRRAVDLRTA